jgi:DNA-binding winged helix-turn-helix (wHTH) protein
MIYRFDEFELDVGLFELRRAGEVCELTRKAFDLLHYVLRHAGRAVTKEEIYTTLWNDEHVGQSTLPVHIRTIRKALGESAALIRTVRGLGYQITCPVEVLGGETDAAVPAPRPEQRPRSKEDPLDRVARLNGLLYLGLLLVEPRNGGELLRFLALER